ncbi:MAG: hypothetical protein K6T94_24805 [Paenibacillus sp.]|nr:hypothetical protein [Paenibacillus sp.]
MYNDPFFADIINFLLFIFILFTTVLLMVGILRFFQLYSQQPNPTPPTHYPNHSNISLDTTESNNVILDYIKRNFIEDSEDTNEKGQLL